MIHLYYNQQCFDVPILTKSVKKSLFQHFEHIQSCKYVYKAFPSRNCHFKLGRTMIILYQPNISNDYTETIFPLLSILTIGTCNFDMKSLWQGLLWKSHVSSSLIYQAVCLSVVFQLVNSHDLTLLIAIVKCEDSKLTIGAWLMMSRTPF